MYRAAAKEAVATPKLMDICCSTPAIVLAALVYTSPMSEKTSMFMLVNYLYPVTLPRARDGLDEYESYFYVGSSPRVLSVETCASTDPHSAFVVTFSETAPHRGPCPFR